MHYLSRRLQSWRAAPRIVKILALQQFLEGFTPIMALYAIMFERIGGLSFEHIGYLFAIWSVAYVAAELPSGVLADYWSRKKVIIVGGLLRAAGFACWLLWPNFAGYAIGFALWGVMIACSSGALNAYLHTELRAVGRHQKYAKYFGWIMAALSAGMLVGFFVAAVLTLEYSTVLIGLSAASSAAFALLLAFVPESSYPRRDTYLKTLKAGVAEVLTSAKLRYMCYVLFAVFMIIGVLEELLPRIYAGFGLGDSEVSLLVAAALVATIVLLARLEAFVRFSLPKQILAMIAGLVLLPLALLWDIAGASILILLFSLIFHLFRPVFMHHVQETASGEERATIGSVPGLAAGVLGAVAYWAMGVLADYTSEAFAIGAYAFLWLPFLLWLAIRGRRYSISAAKAI